jgi:ABC-type transporter Mla MlaB component
MMDLYQDHCEVVKASLSGARTVDEQTSASVAVLNDRLERVKKLGSKFTRIEFSPAVRQLKNHSSRIVAV